ncbi:hypothetical protein SO802_025905 [Lithocarpus litseifolius]|uniref:RNase H type-1 domain-containing protein n=1 Tax=Lithocarpus litseifolius TaxID=425828 RepID=A0AAW2BY06_9ROSI
MPGTGRYCLKLADMANTWPIQVRIPQLIQWNVPPDLYIKLNTDGSAIGNPRLARARGILRDLSGALWTRTGWYKCSTSTVKLMNVRMHWQSGELTNRTFCLSKVPIPVLRRAANPDALPSSPNWFAIKLGFPTFAKGICWGIGNGSRKSVWIDNWIKGQSLRDLIEGPLTRNDMKLTIADIRDNHEWNWGNLSFVLPSIIKDKIRSVPCQEFGDETDSGRFWLLEASIATRYVLYAESKMSLLGICLESVFSCDNSGLKFMLLKFPLCLFIIFCLNEAREYFYCIANSGRKKQLISIPVKWNKPPKEWFKLNTDGASSGNPGKAGGGGLIRDCNGRWIKGFSRSIEHASSFVAEFWALRDGLKLALGTGVQRLVVELDAKVVISLITSIGGSNKPYFPLLNDCRYLLRRFLQTRVVHVFREGNRCANALARMGSNMDEEFLVFDNPPSPDVLYFVNTDAAGVLYNRSSFYDLTVLVR